MDKRKDFHENVKVPGSACEYNEELAKAGRLADFLELGELFAKDGWKVIIHYNNSKADAETLADSINAKNAVIHVEDVVFSLRIKIENIEANIGEVARQNKINDTEVSATPYVKNIELNI